MTLVSIDTSEVHELASELQTRPARVTGLTEGALRRGGRSVEAAIGARAPVDTGALRTYDGTDHFDLNGLTLEVGPTEDYAVYQEFGTSEMAAQPSVGPGFDQALPGIESDIADAGVDALGW